MSDLDDARVAWGRKEEGDKLFEKEISKEPSIAIANLTVSHGIRSLEHKGSGPK